MSNKKNSSKKPLTPKQAAACCGPIDDLLSPELFKAMGDPTRVKLIACLAKCGRTCSVSEVAECCSVDFSVVSRHLAMLERAGILESKKEGRTVYYGVRYQNLAESLRALPTRSKNAVRARLPSAKEGNVASGDNPRILFICTGNSCRSQMAEALLRHHAGDRYEACSAGLQPKGIHPRTIQVLQEIGVDTSALSSKDIRTFLGKIPVRYAIVVCDKAQNSCPQVYPFAPHNLFWPFDDPAAFQGSEEETLNEFRRVRDEIERAIQKWLQEAAPK